MEEGWGRKTVLAILIVTLSVGCKEVLEVRGKGNEMGSTSGRVIFLNGASSSGKSTIAEKLQCALPDMYLHVSVDTFLHQIPAWMFTVPKRFNQALPALFAGFYCSCAAIARSGTNIIVDTVLDDSPEGTAQCVETFAGLDVMFVGVRCPLATLESREKARGDRQVGLAAYQYARVHTHRAYDVEVDTSQMSVADCVAAIREYLEAGRQPSAFGNLRVV